MHRKSCPHTSQQNGLAEKKLCHILETGLTLLAHSGLSNTYWVDAFLTSVYIINRLPTAVLTYEKLFKIAPNYFVLRVFGCKCFPLLRPYTTHKLEYRPKFVFFLATVLLAIVVLIHFQVKFISLGMSFVMKDFFQQRNMLHCYCHPGLMLLLIILFNSQ